MQLIFKWSQVIVLAGLAACASPGGDRPEFGASVEQMIQLQTDHAEEDLPGMQGDVAAEAMRAYRGDVGDRERFGKGLIHFGTDGASGL